MEKRGGGAWGRCGSAVLEGGGRGEGEDGTFPEAKMRACAALGCLLATVLLLASSVGGDEALSCGERGGGIIEGGGGRGERGRARSSTGDGGEEGIWDLTVVESGFTGCDDRDAWTNDTARVQVSATSLDPPPFLPGRAFVYT